MAAEANIPLDDELNTTAPQDNRPTVWKMPEPIFRRTSGRLPQGFEKQFSSAESSGPASPAIDTYVEPKPKSPTLKIVVVGLAVTAMVAFIIAFLTIIYYFFWRSPE